MNFVIDGNVVATAVPVSAGTAAYSTSSLTGAGSPYTVVAMLAEAASPAQLITRARGR